MTRFIISDTHFNHGNILVYEPWRLSWAKNLKEMNEKFIAEWNAVVKPTDMVYHLGDLGFGNEIQLKELRAALNGEIIITVGNHDRTVTSMKRCGFNAVKTTNIGIGDCTIVARHDPKDFIIADLIGTDMLFHGHLHGQKHYGTIDPIIVPLLFDVGVDAVRRIAPVPLDEMVELFLKNKKDSV